eukprot:TRINITY_DN5692_c0_g1_i3.p1 TRINITY_DN5692_c0_g1~~TRINITY_DN5692_c0_g1_i3.p1  ORF type:complete len:159 (+),score=30.56 TRINITY_DN5692_c0_g1_i3:37-477(+)
MSDVQLVRFRNDGKRGKTFELMCHPGMPAKFRKGLIGFDNVLISDEVWLNHKKGIRAADGDLEDIFGSTDLPAITRRILEDGDIQLTQAERQAIVDKKRREIINYIHKYYVDPKTSLPHPVLRVENAVADVKVCPVTTSMFINATG